jgi:hypothetical protein
VTVATTEPTELRAGDPWAWRREDLTATYPASAWTLEYWFKNQAGGFQIAAVADGDAFAVDESSDDTDGLAAGNYSWQARVINIADNSERHMVDSGTLAVLPTLFVGTATTALDGRTHARKVLDAIHAVIEGRATLDQLEYTIGSRSLKRMTVEDLFLFRDRYTALVKAEEAAANGNPRNKMVVRF